MAYDDPNYRNNSDEKERKARNMKKKEKTEWMTKRDTAFDRSTSLDPSLCWHGPQAGKGMDGSDKPEYPL